MSAAIKNFTPVKNSNIYIFDEFRLDCSNWTLYRDDEIIQLAPRLVDTLVYLVERASQTVTKDDLLRDVWPNQFVEESALTRNISLLRTALGDVYPFRYILTEKGRGYRFLAPVSVQSENDRSKIIEAPVASVVSANALPRRRLRPWLNIALLLLLASLLYLSTWRSGSTKPLYVATQITSNSDERAISAAAISPSGELLAYYDASGLYVSDIHARDRRLLSMPRGLVATNLAWFPATLQLLVSAVDPATHSWELWSIPVFGGESQLLQRNAQMAAASPDGKHIAFVRNDTEIWMADADGHNARQVSSAPTNFSIDRAPMMSVNGKYIVASVFNLQTTHSSIRAFPVDGTEQRVLYDGDAYIGGFVLIKDNELLVSQDVVRNDKTASEVIGMTVDLDVGDPAHGYFKVADWHDQGGYSNALSATPDGSIVALLNGKFAEQIAIADLNAGNDSITNVRLLTHSLQGHRLVQWLKDNKTVLFFAGAGDQYGLYLQSIDSDDVQQIATTASLNIRPAISPDERWLFYFVVDNSSFNPSFKLMQVPMTGGASKQVGVRHDAGWKIRCASKRNLCVMAENDGDQTVFTAYDPDHGRGLELAKLKWNDAGLSYDWDISADGNRIGYLIPRGATQLGATDVGIVNLQQPAAAPQLLHFEHIDSMFTLRWAAEGEGLFAASQTLNSEMACLLHLHLDGTSTPLYCEPNVPNTFGIGSADGKHIAFQKWSNNNNVWLLKRQTD